MSKAARRLGRGLESLVSNLRGGDPAAPETPPSAISAKGDAPKPAQPSAETSVAGPATAPIDSLRPNPFQPRSAVSDSQVESLARSIERNGILQPIAVRRSGSGYEIIAGERRWHAAKTCGMSNIPIVLHKADDEQMIELALVENLQREDLNAIDRARAYRQFCDRFNLKPEVVASRIGEDRTTVVNYLRLLELEPQVQDMVAAGTLSMGHARCLLGIADTERRRVLARSASQQGLSVRALEEIVRREKTRSGGSRTQATGYEDTRSPHLKDMETRLEQAIKTKVTIHEGRRKGTGRITIEYYSLDDFDRITALLGLRGD